MMLFPSFCDDTVFAVASMPPPMRLSQHLDVKAAQSTKGLLSVLITETYFNVPPPCVTKESTSPKRKNFVSHLVLIIEWCPASSKRMRRPSTM